LFGKNRSDIRSILDLPYKTKISEPENDFYEGCGLILGYDANDELEFIEVIPPSSAEYSGLEFFTHTLDEVLSQMRDLGFSSEFEDGGYNFEDIGITFYCPHKRLESVSLYREGYYDMIL
jgi:hypothetical protein